jgi:hypothetical protein
MNASLPCVIIPGQVEGNLSGVFRVEIAIDETVTLVYGDHSRISIRLASLPYAIQSNFIALVRRVQTASQASGQRLASARLL